MSALRRAAPLLAVLAVLLVGTPPASAVAGSCRPLDVEVPAAVTDRQVVDATGTARAPWTVRGVLCLPAGAPPATVLLAMHGITYTHRYWDPGLDWRYSFTKAMTRAGYATFAIDRLGYGTSDHPPSALVSLDSGAAATHALIGRLRAGEIGATAFRRVVLVGHSYGSATAWRETALHNDADAVVATGWASTFQQVPLARWLSRFGPSRLDPAFADRNLDPGYLAPPLGERDRDFLYRRENADPAVIAFDDAELRDTVSLAEASVYRYFGAIPIGEGAASVEVPTSDRTRAIRVPMLLVNGAYELFACGPALAHCASSETLRRAEAPYFSPMACLRAAVIPDAGHNLNLHRNAPLTFATIRAFLDVAVGPDGAAVDRYRAGCGQGNSSAQSRSTSAVNARTVSASPSDRP